MLPIASQIAVDAMKRQFGPQDKELEGNIAVRPVAAVASGWPLFGCCSPRRCAF